MGSGFNAMVRILLLPEIHDTQCGFKLFTAPARDEILPRLRLYRGQNGTFEEPKVTAFDVELLVVARRLGLTTLLFRWPGHLGNVARSTRLATPSPTFPMSRM